MLLLAQVALFGIAGLFALLWSGPVDLVQILFVLVMANLIGVIDGLNKRRI